MSNAQLHDTSGPLGSFASCVCSEMRPLDVHERLDRIEERMATRDDIAALRAEMARMGRSPLRRLGSAVFVAAIVIGFTALVVVFADRLGMAR